MRHSTKFVQCLGGSVKDINTVQWIQLCVAPATVLLSVTWIYMICDYMCHGRGMLLVATTFYMHK